MTPAREAEAYDTHLAGRWEAALHEAAHAAVAIALGVELPVTLVLLNGALGGATLMSFRRLTSAEVLIVVVAGDIGGDLAERYPRPNVAPFQFGTERIPRLGMTAMQFARQCAAKPTDQERIAANATRPQVASPIDSVVVALRERASADQEAREIIDCVSPIIYRVACRLWLDGIVVLGADEVAVDLPSIADREEIEA